MLLLLYFLSSAVSGYGSGLLVPLCRMVSASSSSLGSGLGVSGSGVRKLQVVGASVQRPVLHSYGLPSSSLPVLRRGVGGGAGEVSAVVVLERLKAHDLHTLSLQAHVHDHHPPAAADLKHGSTGSRLAGLTTRKDTDMEPVSPAAMFSVHSHLCGQSLSSLPRGRATFLLLATINQFTNKREINPTIIHGLHPAGEQPEVKPLKPTWLPLHPHKSPAISPDSAQRRSSWWQITKQDPC